MNMPEVVSHEVKTLSRLFDHLQQIYDPRDPQKIKYRLSEVIFIAITALLSGYDGWTGIEEYGNSRKRWLKKYFGITCKIPSHDTFGRIFSLIHPKEFAQAITNWLNHLLSSSSQTEDIINIDGKFIESYSSENPLVLIRAWSAISKRVLAQAKVPSHSNEIPAIPPLLDLLPCLEGKIITIDAIGAQRTIVEKIVEKRGDYVIALKSNQHQFFRDIRDYVDAIIDHNLDAQHTYHETFDKNHGRKETRCCWSTAQLDWLEQKSLWKGLNSIVVVETIIFRKGKTTTNRRYFISSLPADAQRLLHVIRSHWSIENQLHWHLDVTFQEDKSTIKDQFGIQNISFLRTAVISLLSTIFGDIGFSRKRQLVNLHPSTLKKILLS